MIINSAINLNENLHAKSIITERINNINSKLISKKKDVNTNNSFEVKNRSYLEIDGPNVSLNFKQTQLLRY